MQLPDRTLIITGSFFICLIASGFFEPLAQPVVFGGQKGEATVTLLRLFVSNSLDGISDKVSDIIIKYVNFTIKSPLRSRTMQ